MERHKSPRGVRPVRLTELPDDQRFLEHYASGPLYGFIYFIIADSMNLVKIGATNQWDGLRPVIEPRILKVRRDIPFLPLSRVTFTTPMALQMSEPELHEHFESYRVEISGKFDPVGDNEWFQLTDSLKAFVDDVALLEKEFERYAKEAAAYKAHEAAQAAARREPTMPMPEWPKVYPWRHLKDVPAPPSRKLTGFGPIFG